MYVETNERASHIDFEDPFWIQTSLYLSLSLLYFAFVRVKCHVGCTHIVQLHALLGAH
jgi:hypothetical protein